VAIASLTVSRRRILVLSLALCLAGCGSPLGLRTDQAELLRRRCESFATKDGGSAVPEEQRSLDKYRLDLVDPPRRAVSVIGDCP
jgi:hypothetical protein